MNLVSSVNKSKRQFTDLQFEDQIRLSIKKAKLEVSEILISIRDRKAVVSYKGQIVTALPTDFVRLLAEWSSSSKTDLAVRNIVLSSLFSAEEKCAGSAFLAAGLWCVNFIEEIERQHVRITYTELHEVLSFLGGNGMAKAAALAIVELGGLGCKINYEETKSSSTRIISHAGKEIVGDVELLFGDRVDRNFDMKNCFVVAIDGAVESVSSIHNLLESSSQIPIVILANNFLPDVANTMAETWRRDMGKCIPFVVRSWGVENFLDLEKIGVKCVSYDRGDTFSGLRIESTKSLDVLVQPTSCTISGNDKLEVSKLTVEVSQTLGGITGLAKDRIKTLVGHARLSTRSGVVKWENLRDVSSSFSELYSKDLAMPSQSLPAASRATISLQKVLQEIGCVILLVQGEKT